MTLEPTEAVAIKAGTMVATGSVMADLVIFTDHTYAYLAIAGAVVSMMGVIHEVFGHNAEQYTVKEAIVEVIKGLALGVLAIPFWFLVLTEGVVGNITGFELGKVSSSLALIISFALSWYTVPIFDWITEKVRRRANDRT